MQDVRSLTGGNGPVDRRDRRSHMSKIPSAGLGVVSADLVIDREDIARKSCRLGSIEFCEHAREFTALAAAL